MTFHLSGSILLGLIVILGLIFIFKNVRGFRLLKTVTKLRESIRLAKEKKDKELLRIYILKLIDVCEYIYHRESADLSLLRKALRRQSMSVEELLDELERLEWSILAPMDERAQKLITDVALRTAILTGISPWALMDFPIFFMMNWILAKEIVSIYGFRPSCANIISLIKRNIGQMIMAGGLELTSEKLLEDLAEDRFVFLDSPGFLQQALPRIFSALISGLMHANLILIVGYNLLELCRPIPMDLSKKVSLVKGLQRDVSNRYWAHYKKLMPGFQKKTG